MNNDLISREALKRKLIPIKLYDGVYCKVITEKDIDNAPTVEQEVYMTDEDFDLFMRGYKQARKDFEGNQGEWKRHDEWINGEYVGGFYHVNCPCENCYFVKWPMNYCGNCGAKMKADKDCTKLHTESC